MVHDRVRNRARVRLGGRYIYLGDWGTRESKERYRRVLAQWLAAGSPNPWSGPLDGRTHRWTSEGGPTVGDLILRYLDYAEECFHDSKSGSLPQIRSALRFLRTLYSGLPAAEFGPMCLRLVRDSMVQHRGKKTGKPLARKTVNRYVQTIRRVFSWAVGQELVAAETADALRHVEGLRVGRTEAPEVEPVCAVPDEHVHAILPHVSPQIAAMVQIQRLAAMRPGEITTICTNNLIMGGPVWEYRPTTHKYAWRGKGRLIFLGPKAQGIIRPWLRTDLEAPLFQPCEAEERRQAEIRRKTDAQGTRPGNRVRVAERARAWGTTYSTESYRRAVQRACVRAAVPIWTPNQLRHATATFIRREHGLEAAQVVLGHSQADVTQIYAERDLAAYRALMETHG